MAPITWRKNPAIAKSLLQGAADFEVEQAIAILEQQQKNCTPLGEGDNPDREAVTIKSYVTLAPPQAPLQKFEQKSTNKSILWVNFLSLAGAQGPLPTVYTEQLLQRLKLKDFAFRDFLDIFVHRLVALWYKFRRTYKIGVAAVEPEEHQIGKTLLKLIGIKSQNPPINTAINQKLLLTYQDLLWKQHRSAAGLECLLASYFKVPIIIETYQGKWQQPNLAELSVIGALSFRYNALGQTMILGGRIWNQAASINIIVGPLPWLELQSFLPLMLPLNLSPNLSKNLSVTSLAINPNPPSSFAVMRQICQIYTQGSTDLKLQLLIKNNQLKTIVLNRQFALGLNSWLRVLSKTKGDKIHKVSLDLTKNNTK